MKIGDYIVCKKSITKNKYGDKLYNVFFQNEKYRIDNILVYSTKAYTVFHSKFSSAMSLQNGEKIWGTEKNRNYLINGHYLSEYDIIEYFYTIKEERKIKLDILNERR